MKKDYSKSLTTRTAPTFCPYCFKLLDAATSLGTEAVPGPGDFTVCIDCCAVLKYGPDMSLEASSLLEIPMHSRLEFAKLVGHCKEFRSTRPPAKPSSIA